MVVGAWRIRSEKLREDQYREGYIRYLKGKSVEWDGENNVKHMWEQVKQPMVESAREVCGSVRMGERTQSVWWNNEVKSAVRRKEAVWKEVLAPSDEEEKERCMEAYREKKRKVKRCIYQSKK